MAPANKPQKSILTKLGDLKPQQVGDFFALLAEKTKGTTRDGKPYYLCKFRDARRTASYMVWVDGEFFRSCDQEWQAGHFYKLRATYGEHERYGSQIDVLMIRPITDQDRNEGFLETDFEERSRFDSEAMITELRSLTEVSIQNEPLRKLAIHLLDTHREVLKRLPASLRHYHPFPGGWLEHTLAVTHNVLFLTDRYRGHYPEMNPPLNRDLIVAGAVLHEIGRVVEIELGTENLLPPESSIPGRLFGHLLLGRDLVRTAALKQGDIDPELLQLLEHLLVSHLTLPEWGSPRLPMIPEVLILHHADDLDAKLEMYARCLRRDNSDGPFTERDPYLGRNLLKSRSQ